MSQQELDWGAGTKTDRDFEEFHEANPVVYLELAKLARQAKQRGLGRVGIRMLWERLRWHFAVEVTPTPGTEPFRLNDHLTSRYARLLMAQEPDLRGLFETREIRS